MGPKIPWKSEEKEMKPLGIGHDYAHCMGYGCIGTREKCIRYLLHCEAREDAIKKGLEVSLNTYVTPPERGENCPMFWEYKEEEK